MVAEQDCSTKRQLGSLNDWLKRLQPRGSDLERPNTRGMFVGLNGLQTISPFMLDDALPRPCQPRIANVVKKYKKKKKHLTRVLSLLL